MSRYLVLGEWITNPWVRLGQLAAFAQLCYVVDASIRLWRTGSPESRRRALTVGGSLSFFVIFAAAQAALVANGVLRMPFIVSFPFLGMVVAMGYELSSDVLRAAKMSQKLRESELRTDIAAEAAKFGIWIHDLERNEIWASDEWRTMFGFERSEPLNIERYLERLHPEDREAVLRLQTEAIEGGGTYETEYRILFPDGRMRWIGSRGRVEFDRAGKAVLARGASLDITPRKQAEHETMLLRQEVAHVGRVSMMGQLASSLAHEINQPLGAILRNAEAAELFLQEASPDLGEIRAILADIRKDDQRAGAVIERMRTMLKRQTLETRVLDVGDLIHEVTTLAHGDAVARRVKLEVQVPDGLAPVRGDRIHLQQVLVNLILNGMDALNGASAQDRRVGVHARLNGEESIEIAVTDRGPGVPVEELGHIFEPFFTTKPTGMGMGLPISRTIIEAHGGELWATNNENGGATFRFTLKTAQAATL
jgi:two-component system, LuxR family, sensor kinase FixL